MNVRINPHDGLRAPVASPVAGSRSPASADTSRRVGMGMFGSVVVHAALAGVIILAAMISSRPVPEDGATVTLTWTEPPAEDPATPATDAAGGPEQPPEQALEPTRTTEADAPAEPDRLAQAPPPPEPPPPEPPPPEPQPDPPPPDEPVPALAQRVEPLPPEPQPDPPPMDEPVPAVAQRVEPPPPPPEPPPPAPNPPATAKPRPARQAPPARSQTVARLAEAGAGAPSAAPALPVPAPAAVSPGWNAAVAAWLQRNKTYPAAARTRGEEGSGHVRFTVARDGRVLAVELTRPTGSSTLDDALRRLLTGATVPAFPDTMPHDQVTVQVQIRYRLDR